MKNRDIVTNMVFAHWDRRDAGSHRVPSPASRLGPDIGCETLNSCLGSRLSHKSRQKLGPQAKIECRAANQRGHNTQHTDRHSVKHTEMHTEISGIGGQNA